MICIKFGRVIVKILGVPTRKIEYWVGTPSNFGITLKNSKLKIILFISYKISVLPPIKSRMSDCYDVDLRLNQHDSKQTLGGGGGGGGG